MHNQFNDDQTLEGIGVQGLRKEDSHCIPIRGELMGLMEARPIQSTDSRYVYRRHGPLGG